MSDDDDDDVGSAFHYADGEAEWDDNDGWGSDDFPEEEVDLNVSVYVFEAAAISRIKSLYQSVY